MGPLVYEFAKYEENRLKSVKDNLHFKRAQTLRNFLNYGSATLFERKAIR